MENKEEDDFVCLDESFFVNDDYQLTTFKFGSQVLQLYCLQAASTDFDLTGQLVWPGAELLNNYLSKNADMLSGCSVIELGSGVGITGILCGRFCRKVLMTDHNEKVLEILKKNIELCDCSGLQAEKLEWGNSDQLNHILDENPGGFDLVLGADICFQQSSIPLLFDTVKQLLAAGEAKCKFLLAYVSRAKVRGVLYRDKKARAENNLIGRKVLVERCKSLSSIPSMDAMVACQALRRGLVVNEVVGTRRVVKNLEGVIFEIALH